MILLVLTILQDCSPRFHWNEVTSPSFFFIHLFLSGNKTPSRGPIRAKCIDGESPRFVNIFFGQLYFKRNRRIARC